MKISDPHGINVHEMRRELCFLQREWADTKAVLFPKIISNSLYSARYAE
jgi:hypothetical protein